MIIVIPCHNYKLKTGVKKSIAAIFRSGQRYLSGLDRFSCLVGNESRNSTDVVLKVQQVPLMYVRV